MATTTTGLVDRVFDALSESSLALTERVKAGNDRAARVANAVVREVEWSQQEALSLGRQFVHHPTDVVGFTGALYDKSGDLQNRAFDFSRQWIDEMATAARETREAIERITRANREVARSAVEAVKSFADRTRQVFQPGLAQISQAATGRPARRAAQTEEAA